MKMLVYWARGVRLYIALAALLVTAEAAWWAETQYSGALLIQRLEEIYAWLSTGCLVLALLIGPSYKFWPTLPGKLVMRDARRFIGLSAAWFAAWHVGIAYFGILRHTNPFNLATDYQWSVVAGAGAMLILALMASISFDGAIRHLGVWWFRIQRLVYAAGLLVVLHAVLVGVHAAHTMVTLGLLGAALAIIALHAMVGWRRGRHET